MQMALE
jgi:hypothetical protein